MSEVNNEIKYIQELFKESYSKALPQFQRLQRIQDAYENNKPEGWGTMSEIILPLIRTACEQVLPNLMDYLFPKQNMFKLVPHKPLPYEAVSAAETYIEHLVRRRMNIKRPALLTLKDAVKFNVGYGIVETQIISPPTEIINTIFTGANIPETVRQMGIGGEKVVPNYKYVHWQQVIPTPDADTPDDATCVFYLDFIREDILRQMFNAEDSPYSGDAEDIITATRDQKLAGGVYPMWWILTSIGGDSSAINRYKNMNDISKIKMSDTAPVLVPVLKCYFKNEHVWLANGDTKILHDKNKYYTMKCPIVKATLTPDSGNWWAIGDIEAGMDVAAGKNTFVNALMDLMTYYLHPTTIINRMAVNDGENVSLEPYGVINVYGAIGDSVQFAQPPQMPQGALSVGDYLGQEFSESQGVPRQLQGQGTAGLMRGGAQSFESFLQTTMARQKLGGAIIEDSWLRDTIERIIIMAQLLVESEDSYITEDDVNKRYIEKTITTDELRHAFDVVIDLEDKFRKSIHDRNFDVVMYRDILSKDPRIDHEAALEWIIGDQQVVRRLKATPEKMQEQIKMMQQIAQSESPTSTTAGQSQAGSQAQAL